MMFNLKKQQLNTSPLRMFQSIPAQFCEMVCRIGFHTEYAPPEGMMHLVTYFLVFVNDNVIGITARTLNAKKMAQ